MQKTAYSPTQTLKRPLKFDEVFRKQLSQIDQFDAVENVNTNPSIICTDLNNTQFSKTYKRL